MCQLIAPCPKMVYSQGLLNSVLTYTKYISGSATVSESELFLLFSFIKFKYIFRISDVIELWHAILPLAHLKFINL